MKAVILTEAGMSVGFGHLTRCTAISEALKEKGIPSFFVLSADNTVKTFLAGINYRTADWTKEHAKLQSLVAGYDIIIVDSYKADSSVYVSLSTLHKTIVSLDDNNSITYPSGILINGNAYGHALDYIPVAGRVDLLGAKYTPIRKVFWDAPLRRINKHIRTVLVTFGGEDATNQTKPTIESIAKHYPDCHVNVVIGKKSTVLGAMKALPRVTWILQPTAFRMKQVMLASDVAVSAGGQTVYELLRTGLPVISLLTAENARNNVEYLYSKNIIEYAGHWQDKNMQNNILHLLEKLQPLNVRKRMSEMGQQLIDGQGARRIARTLISFEVSSNLTMRKAGLGDTDDIFSLSNDPVVRANSLNPEKISKSKHNKWFADYLVSKNKLFLVVLFRNMLIAQVRYEAHNDRAYISISIVNKYRGLGLGSSILQQSLSSFHKLFPAVPRVIAIVKKENVISQSFFTTNGFTQEKTYRNYVTYGYHYKLKVLVLTNNSISKPIIDWLRAQKEEVLVSGDNITVSDITRLRPDFVISYNYRYIIREDVIALLPNKIINLHTSFLPWNRGADPNIWSFIDDTPKGVTIHVIDKGLDTGNILFQKRIELDEKNETFGTSYKALHWEIQSLFKKHWNVIRAGAVGAKRQRGRGSYHKMSDLITIQAQLGRALYNTTISALKKRLKNKTDR